MVARLHSLLLALAVALAMCQCVVACADAPAKAEAMPCHQQPEHEKAPCGHSTLVAEHAAPVQHVTAAPETTAVVAAMPGHDALCVACFGLVTFGSESTPSVRPPLLTSLRI